VLADSGEEQGRERRGKQGRLPPAQCCGLVLQKDTAVVVHLQHTPGRTESSASVSASTVFGRGQAAPPPALQAVQETGQEASKAEGKGLRPRSAAGREERGPGGCPECCGGWREGALPVADAAVVGASWLGGNAFPADGDAGEAVLGLRIGQKRLVHPSPAPRTPRPPSPQCPAPLP